MIKFPLHFPKNQHSHLKATSQRFQLISFLFNCLINCTINCFPYIFFDLNSRKKEMLLKVIKAIFSE